MLRGTLARPDAQHAQYGDSEYLETQASDDPARSMMNRLYDRVGQFDHLRSHHLFAFSDRPDHTTNSLYRERKIPILLMEQRIGTSKKLGEAVDRRGPARIRRAADRDHGPDRSRAAESIPPVLPGK